MRLKTLLKDLPPGITVKGSKEIDITGICSHSKLVAPGDLFVAKKGMVEDGNRYIQEAIDAGAVALLTDIYNPFLGKVVQLVTSDIASMESTLAAHFYHYPAKELFMVGVTGTNGKTTVAYLVKHLLDTHQKPCGLIGTIENIVGHHRYPSTLTTPDVVTNQRLLREMISQGCKAAVMEVSSHALDQNRIDKISFDAAIFTNLSEEHLDYHKDMEHYAEAKGKLFVSPKVAIVNADSPWTPKIVAGCTSPILTYGIDHAADVRGAELEFRKNSHFHVTYQNETLPFETKLVGKFNISNCLSVIALGLTLGLTLEQLQKGIKNFSPVKGRLEKVENSNIYIDYAHTPDALQNVLKCLQEMKRGKIITVFGCGGNRDRLKRAKMGEISEKFSDVTILTSDNPRDEDPEMICQEIVEGFKKQKTFFIEIDRQKAIEKAIHLAKQEDIILIAGKGHETYQIFGHKTISFDDRKIAELCSQKKSSSSS